LRINFFDTHFFGYYVSIASGDVIAVRHSIYAFYMGRKLTQWLSNHAYGCRYGNRLFRKWPAI
jgi:hypothetical protein